jgi:hypothetical protein
MNNILNTIYLADAVEGKVIILALAEQSRWG